MADFCFHDRFSMGTLRCLFTSGTGLYGGSRAWALQSVPLCGTCLPARSSHRLCPNARPLTEPIGNLQARVFHGRSQPVSLVLLGHLVSYSRLVPAVEPAVVMSIVFAGAPVVTPSSQRCRIHPQAAGRGPLAICSRHLARRARAAAWSCSIDQLHNTSKESC